MSRSTAARVLPLVILLTAASAVAQTRAVTDDRPLWAFPPAESGPVMASTPTSSEPEALAVCSSCHLPGGNGRPDNAALAGLPRTYILAQMQRYRAGQRRSAADYTPAEMMRQIGEATSPADADIAADHYSKLPFRSFVRVVEATALPKVQPTAAIYRRDSAGGTEPLGQRIIEVPDDFARFESGDPETRYTAFVPVGSIARGEAVARGAGLDEAFACTACHGARLQGSGNVPPLAGRSPTATFRQLYNFKVGARAGDDAELMRQAAVELSIADMVAVSAYAASLRP